MTNQNAKDYYLHRILPRTTGEVAFRKREGGVSLLQTDAQRRKYIQMTESPVEPLICKMAVPTIISMLITSIYNMADTFFVGRLGTSATGAVGVGQLYFPPARRAAPRGG